MNILFYLFTDSLNLSPYLMNLQYFSLYNLSIILIMAIRNLLLKFRKMTSKILLAVVLLGFVAVAYCDLTAEEFAAKPWSEKFQYIKTKVEQKVATLPQGERTAALNHGIHYLLHGGPKPTQLSELGQQLVTLLTPQQKQEVADFLKSLKH